jgi:hypothetical protein
MVVKDNTIFNRVLANNTKCGEDQLVVDSSDVPKRAILLYYDLSGIEFKFKDYFDEDGFQMLRHLIHSMDTNWTCGKCDSSIVDANKDSIACDYCYNWSHYSCVKLTKTKASKLSEWFCVKCAK